MSLYTPIDGTSNSGGADPKYCNLYPILHLLVTFPTLQTQGRNAPRR